MASDCENYAELKQKIIQCLKDQESSLSVFRNLIENKDVVIFLGNTRSGKSTLVNYMIGNNLEGWETGKMVFKIRLQGENEGPEIGQGSLSCTTLPGVYKMEGSTNVVVVDPPGFEDNRGVVQDIINCLCINQIIYARTVKFVLVCDINEITSDTIRNFTNSVQQVEDLVSNSDELKNSFSFIFTKDWKNYSQEEIVELLRNKILNQDQLDVSKVLVQNVVQNKKFIGIFKMPTRGGEISDELDVNIKGAVKECHAVDVEKCQIKFAFSDQAQKALLQIYSEYTDTNYFKAETDKIVERFNDYFKIDLYVFASYNLELTLTKTDLENVSSKLSKHRDEDRIQLFEIQRSIDELLELHSSAEFKDSFQFVIMLDKSAMLEDKYKDMIKTNYVKSLSNLYDKVTELLDKINVELKERKTNNIKFAATGLVGALGVGPAVGGALIGGAVAFGICIGGVLVVGAGAGSAFAYYKLTYGRRIKARRTQGRAV